MNDLQTQLNALSTKVDGVYQLIDQLSIRVSEMVSECRLGLDQSHQLGREVGNGHRQYRSPSSFDVSMEHKDILIDNDNLDPSSQNSDRQLTPEIQIQRLTAQLTAAYSRIAALEEQLISHRIH